MNYVLGTGGNCRFRWEMFEFKCLVCEEKVESKSKTERHVLSHFLEESAVGYAMEGREEEAKKEEEEEEIPSKIGFSKRSTWGYPVRGSR